MLNASQFRAGGLVGFDGGDRGWIGEGSVRRLRHGFPGHLLRRCIRRHRPEREYNFRRLLLYPFRLLSRGFRILVLRGGQSTRRPRGRLGNMGPYGAIKMLCGAEECVDWVDTKE